MYSSGAKKNRSPDADMRGAEYDRIGKSDPSGGMIKHFLTYVCNKNRRPEFFCRRTGRSAINPLPAPEIP